MSAVLTLQYPRGTTDPQTIELPEHGVLTLGRDKENNVVLHGGEFPYSISRFHASIQKIDGIWHVSDNVSTNGMFLNDERLEPGEDYPLSNNDKVYFGNRKYYCLEYKFEERSIPKSNKVMKHSRVPLESLFEHSIWSPIASFLDLPLLFNVRRVSLNFHHHTSIYLEQLTSVRWMNGWNPIGIHTVLKYCINVKSINASNCFNIQATFVESIYKNAGKIESLDFSNCNQLSGFLSEFRNIRSLSLKQFRSIDSVRDLIPFAQKCTQLEHLNLIDTRGTSKSFLELVTFTPNLLSICLGREAEPKMITDAVLVAIGDNCKKLEKLTLRGAQSISDQGISRFLQARGQTLQHLSVTVGRKLTDDFLSNSKNLESLSMNKTPLLTDRGLNKFIIASGHNIKYLDISCCKKITDHSVLSIANYCKKLTRLELNSCDQITSTSVIQIAQKCRYLKHIDMSSCPNVDDQAVDALKCLPLDHVILRNILLPPESKKALELALGKQAIIKY